MEKTQAPLFPDELQVLVALYKEENLRLFCAGAWKGTGSYINYLIDSMMGIGDQIPRSWMT